MQRPHDMFAVLELASDLRLGSIIDICAEKLAVMQARTVLACLTQDWIDGASLEATRAALAALKRCPH